MKIEHLIPAYKYGKPVLTGSGVDGAYNRRAVDCPTVFRHNGKYMMLHLGDGCAIHLPHTGDPMVVSAPDNGLTSCHTWLTTSENIVPHFHVTFGSLTSTKRILLLSDGATCFCRGRNIPRQAKELIKNRSQLQLQDCLMQSNPIDDATCIVLDVCK